MPARRDRGIVGIVRTGQFCVPGCQLDTAFADHRPDLGRGSGAASCFSPRGDQSPVRTLPQPSTHPHGSASACAASGPHEPGA